MLLNICVTCPGVMDSSSEQLAAGEDEATCTSASEGLEEGEVEGETLLIVESEDQGSVDLSHDQSGDSLTSDVGEETDGGWACEDMSFYCDRCHKWVPAGEMANHSSPSPTGCSDLVNPFPGLGPETVLPGLRISSCSP